jgi:23S rRNA pseudouridine1911/1915/1917 synthase
MKIKTIHDEEENEQSTKIEFTADPGQELLRIDRYLMHRIPNATRNKIQQGIKDGLVQVNGEPVKSNYKVRGGDKIVVQQEEKDYPTEIIPEPVPLDIRYEDESVMVIYKPAGLVVHPGYNNWTGTLVNGLAYYFDRLPTSKNGALRPGLVHRIDKETTGLLVIAKTEPAMSHLANQFAEHTSERTYEAIVWGIPKEENGTITGHIGRSLKDRKVCTVFPNSEYGKHAVTHYEVLETLRYVSLIRCKLETGRTHQIRAHMKHLGHPLFGDPTYGGNKILKGERFSRYKQFVENCFKILPRQALHAKTLGFKHPEKDKFLQFDSDLPTDMVEVLEKWRNYVKHY